MGWRHSISQYVCRENNKRQLQLFDLFKIDLFLPLKSSTTPGGCILTAGLGFNLAGSKCLGGGPELGGIRICCLVTCLVDDEAAAAAAAMMLIPDSGLDGE